MRKICSFILLLLLAGTYRSAFATEAIPALKAFVDAPSEDFVLFDGIFEASKGIAKEAYNYQLKEEDYNTVMSGYAEAIQAMITADDPEMKLNAISQYLFNIKAVKILPESTRPLKPEYLLAPFILKTNEGLNFAVAAIYFSLADHLGVELSAIEKGEEIILVHEAGGQKYLVDIAKSGKVLTEKFDDYFKVDLSEDEDASINTREFLGFYIRRASILLGARGLHEKAIAYLDYAKQLYAEDAEIPRELGTVYEILKDTDKAEALWKESLEKNPRFTRAYLKLAVLYMNSKEYDKVEALLKGLDQYDEKMAHHGLIAISYVAQEKYKEALEHFLIEKKGNPDKENVYLNIAKVYTKLGEYEKALTVYDEAIERFPEQTEFYTKKAYIYFELGDIDALMNAANASLEKNPDDTSAYALRALGLYEQEKKEEAEDLIDQTIDKYEDDWKAASIYADYLLNEIEDPKEARKYYKKALKRNKDSAQLLYQYGITYYHEGKPMSAQIEFERGLKNYEGKQQALFHLGLALTDTMRKKFENAMKHYKIAKEHGFENTKLEDRFLRYQQTGK